MFYVVEYAKKGMWARFIKLMGHPDNEDIAKGIVTALIHMGISARVIELKK